jgi:outer membrane murein-binding lipoprotein Lpp
MIDKIKSWLILFLIGVDLVLLVSNRIKDSKLEKQSEKITELESKVEHLELARKADVAANNKKAELENKMDSSKDLDNLNHVPDADILNQLRSNPV